MTCEEALVLLSGHLDGANTPEEEARLEAHLARCPDCRRILDAYTAMDQGILELSEEPPAQLHDRIMAAVAAEPKPNRRRRVRPAVMGLAAAAVLCLALGLGYLPRQTEDPAQPAVARVNNTLADALPVQEEPSTQEAAPAQEESPEAATRDLPSSAAAPATFSVEPEAAAESLLVELGDNAASPAVETIPQLEGQTVEIDGACGVYHFTLDAATVRQIIADYSELYGFRTHGDLENAADDTPCDLVIVCG